MEHKFTTLNNFRDLGGLTGAEGRKIKRKRLLRCGVPYQLSKEDKKALCDGYGLRLLIDLRSPSEIQKQPDDVMDGVRWFHCDVTRGRRDNQANPENTGKLQGENAVFQSMAATYGNLIREKEAAEEYRRMFDQLLSMKEGAAALHCYGGKDRTGIAAALVLTALGVCREDIEADYLRTNDLQLLTPDEEYEKYCGGLGERIPREDHTPLAIADARYLQKMYEAAEELCGSIEMYLHKRVSLTAEEMERLQELYLGSRSPISFQDKSLRST